MKKLAFLFASFAVLGGMLAAAGCATERSPIDRVQPFALSKAFFVGADFKDTKDDPEFWYQATLVDVGYGAAQDGVFTSTYAQPIARIKWEITEDYLIARLAYERIAGSDGKGVGGPVQDGVVVAMYAIDSHFDIANAYNPTTGEKLNIIEENDSDRPWNLRTYFHVDFSKNENTDSYDFDLLSSMGVYGGVEYESQAYYVDDPSHPDAPRFELDAGYFDVTNKAFAKPKLIDLSHLGWGIDSFPACMMDPDFAGGTGPNGSCNPVELTIRSSFRRVVDDDYEPVEWDGFRFQAYGGFTTDRHGYARNYGMTDEMWHRFLSRFQIWERTHRYADPAAMTGHIPCFTPGTTPFGSDPHRDENKDGTEDECADAGAGSRCDEFKQRCTLPYAERTPKTLAWYYASGSDPDYFEATGRAAHEWDVALRTAVRAAQYGECRATNGQDCEGRFPMYWGQQDENDDAMALAYEVDGCRLGTAYPEKGRDEGACTALADEIGAARGYSAGVISIAKMAEMIVLCHSPVEAGDPGACGGPRLPDGMTAAGCKEAWDKGDRATLATCDGALTVRRGDIRFHILNVVEEPQTPSPWGIMTDSEDPLTGQTIASCANVWSYVTELWARGTVDRLRYIKGELKTEEVTEGVDVAEWARAAEAASGGGVLPKLTAEDRDRMLAEFGRAGIDPGAATAEPGAPAAPLDPAIVEAAAKLRDDAKGILATADRTASMSPTYLARARHAHGSAMEAELLTPMVRQLHGTEGLPMTGAALDMASPLRGGNPTLARELRNLRENALAERGACILREAEAPLGLAPLADILEAKFGAFNPADPKPVQEERASRMARFVAQRAHYSVVAHEMGHSVGHRHNFVSSSDAWNYKAQYWQLRTKNASVMAPCTSLSSDGEDCVGPRYFDPVTKNERDNLIWMFMTSSIMEYPGETTQDFLALGAWDFAATRSFYGDVTAVYRDESWKAGTDKANLALAKMDNFGGILGITHRMGQDDVHYTALQRYAEMIKDCAPVDKDAFRPGGWNEERDGVWHPVLDGQLVAVDGEWKRCKQPQVDYVRWQDLKMPEGFGGYFRSDRGVDGAGRVRVPYGFATDRWADLGNLSVYRHDNGADAYEIFDFLVTQQEVNHIFDNYRRGRETFSVRNASNRTLTRYNEKMRDGAKGLTLMRNIYRDFSLAQGYNFDQFWPSIGPMFFPDNILASGMVFDHFTRTLTRPQAGAHFVEAGTDFLQAADDYVGNPGATRVTIPNGVKGTFAGIVPGGRPVENRLAEGMGEYDSEYTVNAGSYYDKMWAPMLFSESVDNFISDSRMDFVDSRYRACSLADLFPEGYRRLLANMLTGDRFIKGPRVEADNSGKPILDDAGFPASGIGWTSWWGDAPKVCFPSASSPICTSYGSTDDSPFGGHAASRTAAVDPQVGWEQQKFLIAMTLLYLPENQKQRWINQMRVWELGEDADPGFENRIEFHDPYGKVHVAKTFGKETIFGRTVQKGVAARVLEYANQLVEAAFVTTTDGVPDLDGDKKPDWAIPVLNPETGEPMVRFDPTVSAIQNGYVYPNGIDGCNKDDSSACTCAANRACVELEDYASLPFFLRQAMHAYGLADPAPKGLY
ncbi:MAG: hypothetical protein FJ087_08335 [Deltaproteobacteria bacterium]|nr:hypothetical protein [Deltaproteobacteria bacterium]